MKKIALNIVILGILTSGFANEFLDAKITKFEKVDWKKDSLSQHDFNVEFLYNNMNCHARMYFNNNEISSKEFFCKEKNGLEFYSEFPSLLNQKHRYILVNKIDKTKVKDLNSIKFLDLAIQKNNMQ